MLTADVIVDAFNEKGRELGGPFWHELPEVERERIVRTATALRHAPVAVTEPVLVALNAAGEERAMLRLDDQPWPVEEMAEIMASWLDADPTRVVTLRRAAALSAIEAAPEPPAPAPVGGEPVAWVSQKALDLVREQGRSESDVTLWGQGYADEHVPLYASPAVDRAGIIETAAVAGWNAFRKSLYAVCEDVQRQADDTRIKATVGSASQEHHAKGYHAGINYAAKSIARGFNAMEAMDDDNLVAAISPTRDKRT